MPTTHYSLSLNESMSRFVIEIAENSKYSDLENALRASIVFCALTQRVIRKFEQKMSEINAARIQLNVPATDLLDMSDKELKNSTISNRTKKHLLDKKHKLDEDMKDAYFGALNEIQALHVQTENGTILRVQSNIKDFE